MQCNVWIHGARLRLRLIQMITAAQNNALEVILSLAKKMWGVYFSPKLARRTQECIGHHVDFQNKIKQILHRSNTKCRPIPSTHYGCKYSASNVQKGRNKTMRERQCHWVKPTVSLEVVYLIYASNFKEFINFKALLYGCIFSQAL